MYWNKCSNYWRITSAHTPNLLKIFCGFCIFFFIYFHFTDFSKSMQAVYMWFYVGSYQLCCKRFDFCINYVKGLKVIVSTLVCQPFDQQCRLLQALSRVAVNRPFLYLMILFLGGFRTISKAFNLHFSYTVPTQVKW